MRPTASTRWCCDFLRLLRTIRVTIRVDKDDKDKDDDVKGQLVAGLGMWLKRDPITDDVFVSWIDPGGAADRAGVAEGSVLTALATRVDTDKESLDDTDDAPRPAPRVRRVRGRGDDPNDRSLLRLSQVRAVLAGRDRTRSGERLSEISPVEAAGAAGNVVVAELWLRRNLAAGDDVEKIAKRRGLPKLRLFRRRAEAKRKAKLAQAMVGAGEAEIIAGKDGAVPEEDNDEEEDDEEAGDDGDDDEDDEDEDEDEDEDDDKSDKNRGERGGSPVAAARARRSTQVAPRGHRRPAVHRQRRRLRRLRRSLRRRYPGWGREEDTVRRRRRRRQPGEDGGRATTRLRGGCG